MKILNLYAGIGGNRKLWGDGHEVTAVENNEKIANVYKRLNPNDTMVVGDARQYLLDHYSEFDFVWGSPPCQTHSKLNKATRHKLVRYIDMTLYEEIMFLREYFKGLFVVENVTPFYEPLIKPTAKIGRHLFWANFDISNKKHSSPKGFSKLSTVAGKKVMMDWLGIHYKENIYYGKNHCPVQILRNCIHPDIGLHILNCALNKNYQPDYNLGGLFNQPAA